MRGVRKAIVVVGSINMDLVTNTGRIPSEGETLTGEDFQTHPGGKGANQAVAIGRLGYPVRMIGCVGSDAFGEELNASLEDAGVDISAVRTTEGSSGVAVIIVAKQGENCIIITPGANALVTSEDIDANIETIRSAGLILTQLDLPLSTVEHLSMICTSEGIPLMLDPAPARQLPATLLKNLAWFTPNETEAAFYLGSVDGGDTLDTVTAAKALMAQGPLATVLKLGSRGAYVALQEGKAYAVDAYSVNAVDTTAAGDAFNVAFATGLMMGWSAERSAAFAAAAAAISVTRPGAQPSMPSLQEVEDLMDQVRERSGVRDGMQR